jgi:RNA polymerase sigma-70 factor (ECF subfamily)
MVDTDDLVQGAMTRTLARLDQIDSSLRGSLLAYLRRAVLNQIRDEIRRARRRPPGDVLTEDLVAADRDPLDAAISQEARERYEAALASLPADQQEAFIMRIEMACAYREIAAFIGRPSAEAARMLVRRAVASLVERLRERVRR